MVAATSDGPEPAGARRDLAYLITTVCLGNICRSPIAEAVLRAGLAEAGLAESVVVRSAGTSGWHAGSDADPRALATLREAGFELKHSASPLTPEWVAESNLVLTMDSDNLTQVRQLAQRAGISADQVRPLRSFDPTAEPGAEVPDPYYGGIDGFREVLDMIGRAAEGVVEFVESELTR